MKLNHRYQVSFSSMLARLLRVLVTFRREFPAPAPTSTPEPMPATEPISDLPSEATKPPAINKPASPKPIPEPTRPCLTRTEPTLGASDPYPTCEPFDPKDLE